MAADVANADDLYGLAPGEFVAARDALARRLRAEGDREEAAVVKVLRRPSATAAALNLAARAHPDLLEQALDAGERLRAATEDALEGDASSLRATTAEERAASGRFLTAAEAFLGSASPDARQRMGATLRAALLDGVVLDALRRGVLTTDHEPSGGGFGLGEAAGAASRPASRTKRASTRTKRADGDVTPAEAERRRELVATVARLEKASNARTDAAGKAAAKAERAEVGALEAEAAAVEARAAADAAAVAARAARAEADEAADELARARTALDDQR